MRIAKPKYVFILEKEDIGDVSRHIKERNKDSKITLVKTLDAFVGSN